MAIARDEVKFVHGFVIQSIYHEDRLLLDRTRNFITANAFLAAGLAVSYTVTREATDLTYIIGAVALVLALLQVALGRRSERAIFFWRVYAEMLEKLLDLPLDSSLFAFYEKGRAKVKPGEIVSKHPGQKPMFSSVPWVFSFMPSTNILVGVVIPWLVAWFWTSIIGLILWPLDHSWAIGLAMVVLLLFVAS